MSERRVQAAKAPLRARVRAVPSKSVTHRVLLAAALADSPSTLIDPLDADDTRATADGLAALGIEVLRSSGEWEVRPRAGRVPGGGAIFLHGSGTSLRFLIALAALGENPSRFDGSPRLRERPTQELAHALVRLGGRVRLGDAPGGLPLEVGGARPRGGAATLPAGRSSQFASALMLIGSRLPAGLDLSLEPPVVSLPYIELSERVLVKFGARVQRLDRRRWRVEPGGYRGQQVRIEGDHSSASYFLLAAAVRGGSVRVDGLEPESPQPDARLRRILEDLGCAVRVGADWVEVECAGRIPGFEVDLTDAPDLAPTLAVLALFAEGPSRLRGVAHLRLKESDRIEVLARNLEALGRHVRVGESTLEIGGPQAPPRGSYRILTASDHRIAMAFAVAGLRIDGIVVDDDTCVAKSNPGFWDQLASLEGQIGA